MGKMLKYGLAFTSLLGLSSCGSMGYLVETYASVDTTYVTLPEDTYQVWDRPDLGRMLLAPSNGEVFRQQLLWDRVAPVAFQQAAEGWLAQTGRPQCRVVNVRFMIMPEYEAWYVCDGA